MEEKKQKDLLIIMPAYNEKKYCAGSGKTGETGDC